MSYPIDHSQVHLTFKDRKSDKFYALSLLVNAYGKATVLRRFGKNNGTFGELIVENFDTQAKAEKLFEKLLREKTGKGYSITNQGETQCRDSAALRLAVGVAVWPKLPPSVIQHLDLGIPTDGRKDLDPPRFNDDGKFIGDPKPRVFTPEEVAAAKEAERLAEVEEAKRVYGTNSNFGRF